jgi:hypothetical protein
MGAVREQPRRAATLLRDAGPRGSTTLAARPAAIVATNNPDLVGGLYPFPFIEDAGWISQTPT